MEDKDLDHCGIIWWVSVDMGDPIITGRFIFMENQPPNMNKTKGCPHDLGHLHIFFQELQGGVPWPPLDSEVDL